MEYNLNKLLDFKSLESNGYTIKHDSDWLYAQRSFIPAQGWKIHLSSTVEAFGDMLNNVVPIIIKFECAFKIPVKEHSLLSLIMGGAGYLASGKLITVYPTRQDNDSLKRISESLASVCRFETFPKILTDLQYENSNVFLRYGAMREAPELDFLGEPRYMLTDSDGHYQSDVRKPGAYKPSWALLPDFLKHSAELPSSEKNIKLSDIGISNPSVLKRHAKGFIYRVKYRQMPAILKQGRKDALLDNHGRSAADRLVNEYHFLSKVQGFCNCPDIYDFFETDDSVYLLESEMKGKTLQQFFDNGKDFSPKEIRTVFMQLTMQIKELHQQGVIFRDLSEGNFIISPDLKVSLIDFEAMSKVNEPSPFGALTPGYVAVDRVHRNGRRVSPEADIYAIGALLFKACTGFTPAFNEATSIDSLPIFFNKLKRIALNSCVNQEKNILANIGIKIMQGILSINQVIEMLNHYRKCAIERKLTASVSNDPIQPLVENLLRRTVCQIHEENLYKTLADNYYPVSLEHGFLGILLNNLLYKKQTGSYVEERKYQKIILNIPKYFPQSVATPHNLMNGDILLVPLIEEFTKNFGVSELVGYEEDLLTSLDSQLVNKQDCFYTGLFYGLAGIGDILIKTMDNSMTIAVHKKKSEIIHKIFNILRSRAYEVDRGLQIDYAEAKGFPQYENVNDLAYGMAGVGLFINEYSMRFPNKTSEAFLQGIVEEINKEAIDTVQDTLIFRQYNRSEESPVGLANGIEGAGFFLFEYLRKHNDSSVFRIAKNIRSQEMLRENFSDASLLSGVAGDLAFLCKAAQTLTDVTRLRSLLLDLLSERSGKLFWTDNAHYYDSSTLFTEGASGILYSLILSMRFDRP
ncbi:protein kinase (plasmid) [Lacticaseibacillus paracasei subsp. paracasei]|uniref:class III lanthionine synthetase LanKC N-terminal domain-containing protein n=1 Tax=Lacticaseibacillus paracasei TaxID=1597 RepID=UPI001892B807|nr:lanthionine synthetase LanC family protein [Lacticaseibacillus paracasei]QPC20543.1 protein kinase [Lacticaseibacillus paracasei subsp. tolerans]UJS09221.1 protein kinase [Lacticaseibacillus paracasei subsp. paracasei]